MKSFCAGVVVGLFFAVVIIVEAKKQPQPSGIPSPANPPLNYTPSGVPAPPSGMPPAMEPPTSPGRVPEKL